MNQQAQPGHIRNNGVTVTGHGTAEITGSVIGRHGMVINHPPPAARAGLADPVPDARADIGVITVLSEETSAVEHVLAGPGPAETVAYGGIRFQQVRVRAGDRNVTVVATQAIDRGQRSAALAFSRLREFFAPAIIVLVGIAGGISHSVSLGDVIIAQDVICYDARKVTAAGETRRGHAHPVPAPVRHAINAFFADHGEPYHARIAGRAGTGRSCLVMRGPVGSGEAVIADRDAAIRGYLAAFNDQVLAVDTEAAGVAAACYETARTAGAATGWLAVRGISDHADAAKDDAWHDIASWHAAVIFRQLLPYLLNGSPPRPPHGRS